MFGIPLYLIIMAIVGSVILLAIGFLVGDMLHPKLSKKRKKITNNETISNPKSDSSLLSNQTIENINSITKKLKEVERKFNIKESNEILSKDIELFLRNIDERINLISIRMKLYSLNKITIGQSYLNSDQSEDIVEATENVSEEDVVELPFSNKKISRTQFPTIKTQEQEFSHSPQEELITLYNEALDNRELRDTLWQKFQVLSFGNVNATDQRLGNTNKPSFQQTDDGNLYAVEKFANSIYWVLPKFDFTVKSTNYENTIKHLFVCSDYDENSTYTRVKVQSPAVFVKKEDHWDLNSKGKLILEK